MADRGTIVEKVRGITERVGADKGLEVVDILMLGGGGTRVLRIFIDKPEGVTHADCEYISQNVGTILDVEDVIPGGRYTLEVSSPGVERKLLNSQASPRFQGKKARITLRTAVEGRRNWEGTLAGYDNGEETLETAPGKTLRIPLDQVQK